MNKVEINHGLRLDRSGSNDDPINSSFFVLLNSMTVRLYIKRIMVMVDHVAEIIPLDALFLTFSI